MKPVNGKYVPHNTYTRCDEASACDVCGMCENFNKHSAKCHECYDEPGLRCFCAEQGYTALARFINETTDMPMYDKNRANGKVIHHSDIIQQQEKYARIMKNIYLEED
jgi:hypothetical protein